MDSTCVKSSELIDVPMFSGSRFFPSITLSRNEESSRLPIPCGDAPDVFVRLNGIMPHLINENSPLVSSGVIAVVFARIAQINLNESL